MMISTHGLRQIHYRPLKTFLSPPEGTRDETLTKLGDIMRSVLALMFRKWRAKKSGHGPRDWLTLLRRSSALTKLVCWRTRGDQPGGAIFIGE